MKQVKWYPVIEKDAIPLKEGRRISFGACEAALFRLDDGSYRAVDGRCPHKSGPLADGIVSGKAVFCPLHNWKINLENGCALSGGEGRVKTYPVQVKGNKVCVAFDEGKLSATNEKTADVSSSVEID